MPTFYLYLRVILNLKRLLFKVLENIKLKYINKGELKFSNHNLLISIFFPILLFPHVFLTAQMSYVKEVFDGTVVNGNKNFYFINPTELNPSYSGSFDSSLKPNLKIYKIENGLPIYPAIAEYEFDRDKGLKIGDDIDNDLYVLNWKTHDFNLDPNEYYQIKVFVNNLLMGYITISGDLNNRTIPIKFRLEKGCTNWSAVGPEGGQSTFDNGIMFDIPSGALNSYQVIGIDNLPSDKLQTLLDERDYRSSGKRVLGGFIGKPEGTTFNKPVKVKMPILPTSKIPLQVKMSLDPFEYWIEPSEIIYNLSSDEIEFTLVDFSGHSSIEIVGAEIDIPENCSSGRIKVVSKSDEFQGGQGCQIIGENIEVTFLDCPGQPTQSVYMSETTPDCDELGLTVEVTSSGVNVCRSKELQAVVKDKNGIIWDIPLTWIIENSSAAKISGNNGLITGLEEGSVVVKAKTHDPRIWGFGTIQVLPPPPIIIRPGVILLDTNEELTLSALDENGQPYGCEGSENSQVSWSCGDNDIATIDSETGIVKGVSSGETSITATLGSASGTALVIVEGEECDADNDGKLDENMQQGWRVCCCGAGDPGYGWGPCPAPEGSAMWGEKCKTGEIRYVIVPIGINNGFDYIDWSNETVAKNVSFKTKYSINPSFKMQSMDIIGDRSHLKVDLNKDIFKYIFEQTNIYPNPSGPIVNIETPIQEISKIEIYSILGQKVAEITSNFGSISTEKLSKGIYMIKISSEKESILRRFVKE